MSFGLPLWKGILSNWAATSLQKWTRPYKACWENSGRTNPVLTYFISVLKAKVKSRNVQLEFAGVLRNWASSLNVKGGNKKPAKHKTTLNSNVFNLRPRGKMRKAKHRCSDPSRQRKEQRGRAEGRAGKRAESGREKRKEEEQSGRRKSRAEGGGRARGWKKQTKAKSRSNQDGYHRHVWHQERVKTFMRGPLTGALGYA